MENKVSKIIKLEFKAEPLEIKKVSEGFSHHNYFVKLNKFPYEALVRLSSNFDKRFNLAKEKWVMEKLARHGIPSPKIYAFDNTRKRIDEEYIIIEKFRGKNLGSIWPSLSEKEKSDVTETIGKLLSKMHEIKFEEFGDIVEGGKIDSDLPFLFKKIGKQLSYSPFLRALLRYFFEDFSRLASYKKVSRKFLLKFIDFVLKELNTMDYKGKPTFVHGDFMPGHLFVEHINGKYNITGIVDFEFSTSSAPEYDFIKLHRQGFFDNPALFRALEKGYGRINKKAVKVYRLMRDLGFAQVVLDAGNKRLFDKTIRSIEKSI